MDFLFSDANMLCFQMFKISGSYELEPLMFYHKFHTHTKLQEKLQPCLFEL
jgi:hypothetical protein